MIKYNFEKHLKDNWWNTSDTFSLVEKWIGKSNMLNSQYTKKYYLPTKYYDVDNINVKFEKCILAIDCKLKEQKESKVMRIIIK